MGSRHDCDDLPAGNGLVLPPHWQTERPPSWWAMVLACAADATMFASLLFGGLFLWLVAPQWPPAVIAQPSLALAVLAALLVCAASLSGHLAVRTLQERGPVPLWLGLVGAAQLGAAFLFLLMAAQIPAPTSHAHQATSFAILVYAAIHAGIGAIFALHGFWRWHGGYLSALRSLDLRIARLWHDYAAVTGLISLAATFLLAFLASAPAEGARP